MKCFLSLTKISLLFCMFAHVTYAQSPIPVPSTSPADSLPKKQLSFTKKPVLDLAFSSYFTHVPIGSLPSDSQWQAKGRQFLTTVYFLHGSNFRVGLGAGFSATEANSAEGNQNCWQVPVYLSMRLSPYRVYVRSDMGLNITGVIQQQMYTTTTSPKITVSDHLKRNTPFANVTLGLEVIPDQLMLELGYRLAPMPYPLTGKRQIPERFFMLSLHALLD